MIRRQVDRIRRMVKWAVSEEIVPPTMYTALQTVTGLKAGRTDAEESDPVEPVPEGDIEAVKPHVRRQVWAAIQLQLLTGARPSEILLMRECDIDASGDVWLYRPRRHKTQHRGRRVIFLGPRAQLILRPYLSDNPEQFVFRPADGRADFVGRKYRDGATVAVRNSEADNQPYTHHGYDSSIRRACKLANVPPWSPGRLRHNTATMVRREFGDIDAARVVLGHAETTVTTIYAERDLEAARAVVARIGWRTIGARGDRVAPESRPS